MKVLIIGGKSSLGLELELFLKSNYQVFTAGRSECDIYLDLSKNCDSEIDFKCDVVILTAAVFGGNDLNSYENNIIVNVLGTARSIKMASKFGAKHFILISSMSIFQNEISPNYKIYSITKKQSEEIAEFVTYSIKMPLTILRPSQLYGENKSFKKHQPLLYKIIECVEVNEDITFHGKKNSIRNYLHVNDFNEIIRRVIDLKVIGNYDCVNTKSTTLIETFNAAINAFKSNSNYNFDNSNDDIFENIFQADLDFFKKIDFEPKIDIINGMKRIANSKNK
jgi:nucleoside-diphosphate-sugar epimerase